MVHLLPKTDNFCPGTKCVADENRRWHSQLVVAEIGHERAECRLADGHAHHQTEGEYAIHNHLSELGRLCISPAELQGLRIMGHCAYGQIVGLGYSPFEVMKNRVTDRPVIIISAGHHVSPSN